MIQPINQNIICLDIDDAIFNSTSTHVGYLDDDMAILEINLKRIVKLIEKWDFKIFITSSWYSILKLENNNLIYNGYYSDKNKQIPKSYYHTEIRAFKLLSKYLNGYVIGLSCGNRERDIRNLLNDGHKVVTIDDMDLSHIIHDNHLYYCTTGFISNQMLFLIRNFMEENEKKYFCNPYGVLKKEEKPLTQEECEELEVLLKEKG